MTTRRQLGVTQPRIVQRSLHVRPKPAQHQRASTMLAAAPDGATRNLWNLWARNHNQRPRLRLLTLSD